MKCKKCGVELQETDKYCKNCGEKVIDTNNMENEQTDQEIKQTRKNSTKSIILIIIVAIVAFAAFFMIIFSLITSNTEKLICKSDKGNITIMYKNNEIIGYKAYNMTYDLDNQKEYAKSVGIDSYIKEFNTWFSNTTSGSCTINGKKVE